MGFWSLDKRAGARSSPENPWDVRSAVGYSPRDMTTLHKAVFLDRDGVINQTIFRRGAQRAPQDLSEWRWLPDVHEVAQTLQSRGYLLLVATNQPDVARGWQSREQVEAFERDTIGGFR